MLSKGRSFSKLYMVCGELWSSTSGRDTPHWIIRRMFRQLFHVSDISCEKINSVILRRKLRMYWNAFLFFVKHSKPGWYLPTDTDGTISYLFSFAMREFIYHSWCLFYKGKPQNAFLYMEINVKETRLWC